MAFRDFRDCTTTILHQLRGSESEWSQVLDPKHTMTDVQSTYRSAVYALSVDPNLYTRSTVIYNVDKITATTIKAKGFRDQLRSALTSETIDTPLGERSVKELSRELIKHDYYFGPMAVWASDDAGNTVSIGGAICQVWPDPSSAINSNP
jgi:hypothetical protein